MRILVAHKFWYRRGGAESVALDEAAWLEAEGHSVAHFSTAHPLNDPSPWSEYFVPYLELGADGDLSASEKARAALRMFRNVEAARRFEQLLDAYAPDVVHVHGIHRQISPSILVAARRRGIPVVQSLHDHHHLCPADVRLYRGTEPCEPRRCGTYWYGPCVSGRCVRGSLAASALSAAETAWQRLSRAYDGTVARFICPSSYLAREMERGGWRIPCDVVPNAVPIGEAAAELGSGFCVIARLSREKGVEVALQAARDSGLALTVAGEGPLSEQLRAAYPEAEFTGRLDASGVASLIARSRAVIVPSTGIENAPMSVLEAMAASKPVVASAIGGIPEQIANGIDGLLVPPGDVDALARAMLSLDSDAERATALGRAARQRATTSFSPQAHVRGLLGVYREAGAPA